MKTFNRQLAIRVFIFIVAFDTIIMVLDRVLPDKWMRVPWWAVNFPGFPLLYLLDGYLPPKLWCILCLLGVIGLLSALLWSTIAGYVFRRSHVA